MRPRATNWEAHRTAKAYWREHCWTNWQNLREVPLCRKLLQASNLLFSTSDTSTSKIGFSKPLIAGLVGTATQKSEHSTRLSGCKQEWRVANLGCFLKAYTTNCGFSPANSTTDWVVSLVSRPPRTSHNVTAIPANSLVNSLRDLRFIHQCSGSKSPSGALAIRIPMPCGKTCWKI